MRFEKWQACGNDFILTRHPITNVPQLCNRHFGIGADGLLLIKNHSEADAEMVVYNSDGSIAQMCGNGIRCVGRALSKELGRAALRIATGAGIKDILVSEGGVRVEMGRAKEVWSGKIELPERVYTATHIDIGNPHCVLEVASVKGGEVERFGRKIEKMTDLFPEGTNVEFATIKTRRRVRVRVWERGAGRTLACGTGACATAYALFKKGLIEPAVEIELDGGVLEIEVSEAGVVMKGPAERVYIGEIEV